MSKNLIYVFVGVNDPVACQNIDINKGIAYIESNDEIISTADIFVNIPKDHPWSNRLEEVNEIEIYGEGINPENPLIIRKFGTGHEFKEYQHIDRDELVISTPLYTDEKYIDDKDIVVRCIITCENIQDKTLEEIGTDIGLYIARTAAAEQ